MRTRTCVLAGCVAVAAVVCAAGLAAAGGGQIPAVAPPRSGADVPQAAWTTGGVWPDTRLDKKTSVAPRLWGVKWGEIEYGHKVEHCALTPEELPTKLGRLVAGHPRLLIRTESWKGGLSVDELRARAKEAPWAAQFKAPPKGKGRELETALYYLATGDESVIPGLVDYVMSAKTAYNCGGGMVGPCRAYDWIVTSPSLTDAQKRTMRDHLAATAFKCAAVQESGHAFDIFHHRGDCGWMADTLLTGLVLAGEHPDAEKLLCWGAGYFLRNYFRGWQRLGGRWSDYFTGSKIMPLAIACWASAVEEPDIFEVIRRDYGDWLQGHMYFNMAARLPSKTFPTTAAGFQHSQKAELTPYATYMLVGRGYKNPDGYAYLRWRGVEPKKPEGLNALLYDEETDRKKSVFDQDPPCTWLWGRDGNGYVQMRSKGWSKDATVIEFKCGDYVWSHDLNCNNNAFTIYHKGHLAVQSGVYDDYYRGEHDPNYYCQTVSSNSLLVFQPGETWWAQREAFPSHGSQRIPYYGGSTNFTFDEYLSRLDAKRHYEMGEILAFEHAPDFSYSYVCGDATDSYNNPKYCDSSKDHQNTPKLDLFTRSLVYLPESSNLIVFDRVNALEATYRKAWLLHSVGQPQVDGKVVAAEFSAPEEPTPFASTRPSAHRTVLRGVGAKKAGHVEDFDGDTVKITWEGGVIPPPDPTDPGQLFVRTFLPRERVIRRIGGEGYEFWVAGKDRPVVRYTGCIKPGTPHPIEAGKWRIEVSPAKPATFDNFLHLIHIGDTKTEGAPPAEMVTAEGETMLGLAAGNWCVLFGRRGEAAGPVAYRAPDGRTEHLVVDLKRGGRYRVSGLPGGDKTLSASPEGVLRFSTAQAGPVRLTPVP